MTTSKAAQSRCLERLAPPTALFCLGLRESERTISGFPNRSVVPRLQLVERRFIDQQFGGAPTGDLGREADGDAFLGHGSACLIYRALRLTFPPSIH
ncbi:hypothetical protein [Aurantimonas sp. A3-2-R12]|uniref:hypothetical protein n=1 Tax=Aurantimonas sp. A3-2-R12 TaxID=3114362 RepID=UPI002E19115A|nr:hypothetical protein [Aurantimonas sp. A3-2-R12]